MSTPVKYNAHYDSSMDYGITMYDNLPYCRDVDHCNSSHVRMCSGHIIKYFMCQDQEGCYSVDNRDAQTQQLLNRLRLEAQQRALEEQAESPAETADSPSNAITEEQIQGLVTDQQQEPPSPAADPIDLDDIEDW